MKQILLLAALIQSAISPGRGNGKLLAAPSTPQIRSTQLSAANASSTQTVLSFPAGTVTGDLIVIQLGHYASFVNCNSNDGTWTVLYADAGAPYIGGAACAKNISANDLTGTVQVNFSSADSGVLAMTVMVGSKSVQNTYHTQSASASSPVTGPSITATAPALALYFTVNRNTSGGGGTNTISRGTQVASSPVSTSGSTGVLTTEAVSTSSTYAPVYSYTSLGNAIAISEVVVQ